MSKIKIVGISIAVLAVLVGSGVGLWVWSGQGGQPLHTSVAEAQAGSGGQTLAQTTDPNSVSLNKMQEKTEPSGGLSVSQSTGANSLGQISPNSEGLSGNSGTKPSSSAKSILDPSSFSQYDKYKDSEGAMFADVQVGSGSELQPNMKAAVYYKGWLTNGQMFDQSRPDDKGQIQPFIFTLGGGQVIPGWEQGLAGMKVGGTRMLIIPPAVGYGATGQGSIPGNSVLVFQVQLAEVQ